MLTYIPPAYRVRLFLSVDLVGSTAYKSRSDDRNLSWLKAFQKFYSEFPALFTAEFTRSREARRHLDGDITECGPKVWKTIGDEILFVNRVDTVVELGTYVHAFAEALRAFGDRIRADEGQLDAKGNAWVAAFPSPNCSIRLSREGEQDALSGRAELPTEELEKEVDDNPGAFDFLGKGIDGGFRIARNSTTERLTVSPALALLLARAHKNRDTTGFECRFHFSKMEALKGVLGGKPYPVISMSTSRSEEKREFEELEAQLLRLPHLTNNDKLLAYLEKFVKMHAIEEPIVKMNSGAEPGPEPAHYKSYLSHLENERQRQETEIEAGSDGVNDTGDGDVQAVPADVINRANDELS